MLLDGMPKRQIDPDAVSVPATIATARDVPGLLEVGHDALHRSLRDADENRDVAHPRAGLSRETKENVGVVGQKGPRELWRRYRSRSPRRARGVLAVTFA